MIITDRFEVGEKSTSLEPYLIQISGRETGQMHRLGGKDMRIGRDPVCEIMLDDPHVSRTHASISVAGTTLTLKDAGSTNGVFVNGKKITDRRAHV